MDKYINTTENAGKEFYLNFIQKGKIVMLNLLKFKQKADYTDFESLKPKEDISGEEAYKIYIYNILQSMPSILY